MAADRFDDEHKDFLAPAYYAEAVTPSDTVDLRFASRALYVGGGGDVKVVMQGDGTQVTFKAVPTGVLLPISVSRVLATGTTATSIVSVS